MNNFTITLDGKKYTPGKPKAKFWRELSEFDDAKHEIKYNNYIDAHAEMIAKAFANPEVTAEKILENYDIDEIIPLYRDISSWFYGLIYAKMAKLPNDQATAEEK